MILQILAPGLLMGGGPTAVVTVSPPVIAFTIYFAYAMTATIEFTAVQSSELSMQYVHASTEQFAEI